ncbi:MAG: phosphoribosylformylglycinamidine synthase, partial [Nanoarchaeota archaeon]|nr:phosphoribosylformylglycinamidine synthase [Nanoarchaeota archaeon]
NDFVESVKGIADAANKLCWKGDGKSPVAFVSGNVSFYNESIAGKQIDPSPVIACMGYMEDYTKAVTMKIKEKNSSLFLAGERKDELGGSVYYELHKENGLNVPKIEFEKEKNTIYAVIDCIDNGLFLSCHDISDGGLLTTVSEMILGGEADGKIGAEVSLDFSGLRNDKILFSESSGFVFEVNDKNIENVNNIFERHGVKIVKIGKTVENKSLIVQKGSDVLVKLEIDELKKAWTTGVARAMR